MTITVDRLRAIADAYTQAWNSGNPVNVAAFFSSKGTITINGGETWRGHQGVAAMAAGFFGDVPDMHLVCDGVRGAGSHAVYLWTFTGTHAATEHKLSVSGWEEWDLDDGGLIVRSIGNFDADDYAQQAGI